MFPMSIGIVTDTAVDLPITTMLEQGIAYLSHNIVVADDVKRDWRDIDPDKLYSLIETSESLPQLVPADKDNFKKVYLKFLEQHSHIISIHVSKQMSKTIEQAYIARKEIKAEDKITIIDSKTINIALAEIVLEANKLAKENAPKEQILWSIEHIQQSSRLYFVPHSIKWLADRKLSSANTVVKSLQGQCPIFGLANGKIQKLSNAYNSQVNDLISSFLLEEFSNKPIHFALSYAGSNRAAIEDMKRHFESSGLEILQGRAQKMGSLLGLMLGPKSISVYAHRSLGASLKF